MNYYHATEKKPEHGGGWAFMQHNRRSGSAIRCACGAGGWTDPGHASAEEAERCFYDGERAKGIRWATFGQASKCVVCDDWTPDALEAASNLLSPTEHVCRSHFEGPHPIGGTRLDERPEEWLWDRHPFSPGISIMASW